MIARTFLLALVLCVATTATAEEYKEKAVTVFGAGSASCGSWTAEPAYRQGRQSWVAGFVTGHNFYAPGDTAVAPPDGKAMFVWMDRYCAEHPLDSIVNAALALVTELRRQRGVPPARPTGLPP
jgi:hypothetical protein